MNSFIDVLESLNRLLKLLISKLIITIILPNPIFSQSLNFLLVDRLFLFLLHLYFVTRNIKIIFSPTRVTHIHIVGIIQTESGIIICCIRI